MGGLYGSMSDVEIETNVELLVADGYKRRNRLVARIAARYVGKKVPLALCESIERLTQKRSLSFLPMKVERPQRGETSTTGLFETHWKSVPLDLAVFEGRWEVSLREVKEYRSGYYSYSRIYITSILEVRDRVTGATGITRAEITPDDNGPNLFYRHLGDRVLVIRIVGADQIKVLTRFGRGATEIHTVDLHPPRS